MFKFLRSAACISLLLSVYQGLEITMEPNFDGKVPWKTDLKITCMWDVTTKGIDFLINKQSFETHPEFKDRVSLLHSYEESMEKKEQVLTISNVMPSETGTVIGCFVMSDGSKSLPPLTVIGPPTDLVTNVAANPNFTFAEVTFDALPDATRYSVSFKTDTDAEWTKLEDTTETTVKLEDLTPATKYYVTVAAGNIAGYSDELELTPVTFDTLDNREPLPVGNLAIQHEAYNATSVTLTWDLTENQEKGIHVQNVVVVITFNGTEDRVDLDGDAVEYTRQNLSLGKTRFEVIPLNEFSSEELVHEVKEVTVEETRIPPVVIKPVNYTGSLLCEQSVGYNSDEPYTENSNLNLTCMIAEESKANGSLVEWSANDVILQADDDISITSNNKSSNLFISAVNTNHQGVYQCKITTTEFCKFDVEITSPVSGRDPEDAASSHTISTLLLSAIATYLFI